MLMTIRHIRTFCEVCRRGGITRAAEALCVAQPSVSQAIAELEAYYGVKLFERVGRRLILTDQGEKLLPKAQETLARFEEFETAAVDAAARPTVRIGASVTAGQTLIPRLICAVRRRLDGVDCRALVDNAAAVVREVECGGLDFAIVEGRAGGDICAEPYSSDRLCAVCAPGSALPREVSLAGLVELPLLLRLKGSASRDLLDARLAAAGVAAAPIMQSSGNSALIAAAASGLGAAVLPVSLVERHVASGQLREIELTDAELTRTWLLIRRRDKKFTPAQRAAYDVCKSRDF